MKKIILYIFLLFLPYTFIAGQPYSTIRQIGFEQGLPNNYVQCITQDKRGYLWFATDEGLSRYDGIRFVNYLNTSPAPLRPTGKGLSSVMDDPTEPVLWIGTQYAGVNSYDYEKDIFKVYRHDEKNPASLVDDGVTGLSPALDGNLWVSTYNKGVDYFDKKKGTFTHYNTETLGRTFCNTVWTCAEGKGRLLFIGHNDHGLTVLNLRTRTFTNYQAQAGNPNSLPGNTVRHLCIDSRGQVWLATNKGLAVFNPSTRTFRRFDTPGESVTQNCYNVRQVNDHEVWVAPEFGGAVAIDIFNYRIRPFRTTYAQGLYNNYLSLSEQSLRYIFKDKYNNIWLGSWGHGVFMMEHAGPLFHHYLYSAIPSDFFLNNPSVMSVTEDRQGNLYMGTDGGGINIFRDDKRIALYKQNHPGKEDNCMQVALRDSKGTLWFGLYDAGILTFPPIEQDEKRGGLRAKQAYPAGQSTTDVRSFYEDTATATIYVGTSEGIDLFDRDTHRLIRHLNLPTDLVRSVIKDRKGYLWAGTFNGGIFVLSPSGKIVREFNYSKGLPTNTINQLYADEHGNMWAGTSDGLLCFPNSNLSGKFRIYNELNGLDNTFIRAIIEDNRQRLWISTNQSICTLRHDGQFLCYNSVEGQLFGNFTDRSTCRTRTGELCFGSVNGLFRFNPDQLLGQQPLPPVMISGLTISNSIRKGQQGDKDVFIAAGKTAFLTHTDNTFTITFNTADFSFSNRMEYTYRLEGIDKAWYNSNGAHSVTYRNVSPGTYTFIVKAHAKNQDASFSEAKLTIDIAPPFYAAWWAKLLYLLLAAAGILWLLRIYQRRLHLEYLYASEKKRHQQEQALNKERLQFYTNITHELRTPLTLIVGPIEDVEKSPTLSDKDRRTIAVIRRSALRLLRLINELLEFRKTETGNRRLQVVKGDIIRTIRETGLKYVELLQNPEVQFNVELPQQPVEMYYDPEVVTIILDNLISNAVKYTKQGNITLSAATTSDRQFTISVKDTGYGISPEALPHIFDRYYQENSPHQASGTGIGLALVQNLAKLHKGNMAVMSQEGKGSCFTLTLSIDESYPDALHTKAQPDTPVIALPPAQVMPQEETQKATSSSNSKPTILIVEDNPDIRAYIASALSDDFTILVAENGKQGKAIAFESTPDIIISDILMPEMNGYDMCKALKTDVRTSHIPVILLTAKTSMGDKMAGYEIGADSYITKPFSATLLKSRIENIIAQRKALFSPIAPLLQAGKKALEEKRNTFEKSLNQLDRDFLDKLDKLIRENLKSSKLDINFLAGQLFMSNSTLYRKMKSLTGLSTKEYVNRLRMKRAEELLLEGRLSINEIAEAIGIDNVVYFRQCFKKEFGSSPSEYLKHLKEKK